MKIIQKRNRIYVPIPNFVTLYIGLEAAPSIKKDMKLKKRKKKY